MVFKSGSVILFVFACFLPTPAGADHLYDMPVSEGVGYEIDHRIDLIEDQIEDKHYRKSDLRRRLYLDDGDDIFWARMNMMRSSREKEEDPYWGNNLKN